MTVWVLLLRGINVGGRNKLPMTQLTEVLEGLQFSDVRTYIQSGNVVCRRAAPPADGEIESAIEAASGFRPEVLAITADAFREAAAASPFSADDGKTLHVAFLEPAPVAPDTGRLDALKGPTEQYALAARCFYLFAPDGIGRSKLAAGAERALAVTATSRNWNTVQKLTEMLSAAEDSA